MTNSGTTESPVIDFQKELEIHKLVDHLRTYETADFISDLWIECEIYHGQSVSPTNTQRGA